jgi:hypothetical protein
MKPPVGWFDDLDHETYRQMEFQFSMSYSGLKQMDRSPAHWWEYKFGMRKPPTPALHFGRAFHSFAMKTESVIPILKGKPDVTNNKQCEVKLEALRTIVGMQMAMRKCEVAKSILEHPDAIFERTGFFTDPNTGITGIIKPDILIPSCGMIVDLKTTTDASIWAFRRSIRHFKYDWQAHWYLKGANLLDGGIYDTFYIIAVEKEPPFGCMVYEIRDGLFYSEMRINPLLEKFAICVEANRWPCYDNSEVYEL